MGSLRWTINLILVIFAGVFLSPILLIVTVLIRTQLGSPVIFSQLRPGKAGYPFRLYKFRTMTDEKDTYGYLLPDEKRLTQLGKWLRSTSLDELPELFNVIKGDMDLVGPRPLLMHYMALYSPEQARRHEVKPGLTGWAQINGRNAISWEEKFKLDVWYVDNKSILLDFKIILITIIKVLRRDGINQPGQTTVNYFRGSSIHE